MESQREQNFRVPQSYNQEKIGMKKNENHTKTDRIIQNSAKQQQFNSKDVIQQKPTKNLNNKQQNEFYAKSNERNQNQNYLNDQSYEINNISINNSQVQMRAKSVNRISNRHKRRRENNLNMKSNAQNNEKVNQTVIEERSRSKLNSQKSHKSKKSQYSYQSNNNSNSNIKISNFDKLEEARLKTYELQQKLNILVTLIEDQTQISEPRTINEVKYQIVQYSVWDQIKDSAYQIQNEYQSQTGEWDSLVSNLADEVQKYTQRSRILKQNIEFVKTQSYQRSNAEFHQSLRDIEQIYEKNRTQIIYQYDQYQSHLNDGLENVRKDNRDKYKLAEKVIEEVCGDLSQSERISMKDTRSQNERQISCNQRYQNQSEFENSTPRSQVQQQLSQRGRSQPQQQKVSQGIEIINQSNPNNINDSINKPNIPKLPIHMINSQKRDGQSSNRNNIPPLPPTLQSERGNSQRGPNSQRGRTSARGNNNIGQNQNPQCQLFYPSNSNLQQNNSARGIDSKRSNISLEGQAALYSAMANPVIQGAVKVDSKFEKEFEDDYPEAEQTMEFDTDRLQIFPNEYQMLKNMDPDDEQRIVAKQVIFMMHEREIKKQIKLERQDRKMRRQLQKQQQNQNQNQGVTPRNHLLVNSNQKDQNSLKDSSIDSEAKLVKKMHSQNSSLVNAQLNQTFNNSFISLQQQLPTLGTIERYQAFDKQNYKDVRLDDLLNVPIEIDILMKTATEKDIILKIEKEFQDKEQLLKEDRKVLPWTLNDDEESKSEGRSSGVGGRQLIENSSNLVYPFNNNNNKKIYNNGAIQIIDNKNSQVNSQLYNPHESSMPYGGQVSSESFSPDSSSLIEQSMQKDQSQSIVLETPGTEDEVYEEDHSQLYWNHLSNQQNQSKQYQKEQNSNQQINNSQISYNNNGSSANRPSQNLIRQSKLDVITEKQSEFSSSLNTNNKGGGVSHRSVIRNIDCRNSDLYMYRVQSARETPCSKNAEFNKLQFLPQYQEILTNRSGRKQNDIDRDKVDNKNIQKKCKSHRPQNSQANKDPSNLNQNMPLPKQNSLLKRQKSERNQHEDLKNAGIINQPSQFQSYHYQKPYHHQKNAAFNYFNKNEIQQANNFMSIQMNEEPTEQMFKNDNGLLQFTQLSQQTLAVDKNDSMNMNIHQYQMYKNRVQQKSNSPTMLQQMNQFSSIQNHFEESRASSFMNESFEETKDKEKLLYRSQSQIMIRTKTDLYDLVDALDINQINLSIDIPKEGHLQNHQLDQSEFENKSASKLDLHQFRARDNNFRMNNPHSINDQRNNNHGESQNVHMNQGTGMVMLNSNRLAQLLQNPQMTALINYIQNQTHSKIPIENGTREVTTSKRLNANNATNGNSIFTLSTYTEDTLSQQLIPIQRRTIQMLQNFQNNYYNNFAGVLFTLPGGGVSGGVANSSGVLGGVINGADTNNNVVGNPTGYLQQCSTVPSEPGLGSGVYMTLQGLNSGKQQQNMQNQLINKQIQQVTTNQISSTGQQLSKFKLGNSINSLQNQSQIINQTNDTQINLNSTNINQNESISSESILKSIIKNRSQSQNKKFDLSKIKISKNKIIKAGQQIQQQQMLNQGNMKLAQNFSSLNKNQNLPSNQSNLVSSTFIQQQPQTQLSPFHQYNQLSQLQNSNNSFNVIQKSNLSQLSNNYNPANVTNSSGFQMKLKNNNQIRSNNL